MISICKENKRERKKEYVYRIGRNFPGRIMRDSYPLKVVCHNCRITCPRVRAANFIVKYHKAGFIIGNVVYFFQCISKLTSVVDGHKILGSLNFSKIGHFNTEAHSSFH